MYKIFFATDSPITFFKNLKHFKVGVSVDLMINLSKKKLKEEETYDQVENFFKFSKNDPMGDFLCEKS